MEHCPFYFSTCSSNCVASRPGLERESANGAQAQKPCLEKLSCSALGGDEAVWKMELDACWTQAQMSVAVTDRVRRFCPDFSLVWFECGYSLPVSECEQIYSMWSDAVIDRVADCETMIDCNSFQTCVSNAFSVL